MDKLLITKYDKNIITINKNNRINIQLKNKQVLNQ